jgi:hypothetical protein
MQRVLPWITGYEASVKMHDLDAWILTGYRRGQQNSLYPHLCFNNDLQTRAVLPAATCHACVLSHDPLTGDTLAIGDPIALDRYSGWWLRFVK